jgi:hypothetical protein
VSGCAHLSFVYDRVRRIALCHLCDGFCSWSNKTDAESRYSLIHRIDVLYVYFSILTCNQYLVISSLLMLCHLSP